MNFPNRVSITVSKSLQKAISKLDHFQIAMKLVAMFLEGISSQSPSLELIIDRTRPRPGDRDGLLPGADEQREVCAMTKRVTVFLSIRPVPAGMIDQPGIITNIQMFGKALKKPIYHIRLHTLPYGETLLESYGQGE